MEVHLGDDTFGLVLQGSSIGVKNEGVVRGGFRLPWGQRHG